MKFDVNIRLILNINFKISNHFIVLFVIFRNKIIVTYVHKSLLQLHAKEIIN